MSTPEQTILGILQDQEDPLNKTELEDLTGFTQTEVLKALGQLSKTYNIIKTIAGYRLVASGTVAAGENVQSNELRPLLTLFTRYNKAFLPKFIREELGWSKRNTAEMLAKCKQMGLVIPKNNGVYYLSPEGVQYIVRHYPDVEVKAFVLDKAKEQASHFHIVPPHIKAAKEQQAKTVEHAKQQPHPAITQAKSISTSLKLAEQPLVKLPQLTEVPVKIQVLEELACCFGNDVQIQLQQLSGFLREYDRG